MNVLYGIVLVLHLIGWAIVFGGALVAMRPPRIPAGMLHGVLTALITGVALVGLLQMGDADVNNVKISVKLLVAILVTGMVIYGGRNDEKVTRGYLGGIAGLTAVNVALAVLWN